MPLWVPPPPPPLRPSREGGECKELSGNFGVDDANGEVGEQPASLPTRAFRS